MDELTNMFAIVDDANHEYYRFAVIKARISDNTYLVQFDKMNDGDAPPPPLELISVEEMSAVCEPHHKT